MPWFWQGELQGGGVLNDMMCHSLEVGRSCSPSRARRAQPQAQEGLGPDRVAEVVAARIREGAARDRWGPRWTTPRPSEDFARATVTYEDEGGMTVIAEATTSWSFVGAGLRLSLELLGPEYSLSMSSLDAGEALPESRGSRGVGRGPGGEAERRAGAHAGGRQRVGRVRIRGREPPFRPAFLDGKQPELDFEAGLSVTELLMAAYMSAEQERVVGLAARLSTPSCPRWRAGPGSRRRRDEAPLA